MRSHQKVIFILISIISVASLSGCRCSSEVRNEDIQPASVTQPAPDNENEVAASPNSAFPSQPKMDAEMESLSQDIGVRLIFSQDELDEVWTDLQPTISVTESKPTSVNFSENALFIATAPAGISVYVNSYEQKDNVLTVEILLAKAPQDCETKVQYFTSSYIPIGSIPKSHEYNVTYAKNPDPGLCP